VSLAIARQLDDIQHRLDQLEAASRPRYAKSTWIPTYLGATTAGVTTYTTQKGFYARVGNIIVFTGRVIWTAATGTGIAIISIPLTAQNTTDMRYAIALRSSGLTFANNNVVGSLAPNTAAFSMTSLLTNAVPTDVNVEAAGDVIFSGFFFV
jgi:hypothetical protein